MRAAWYEQLGGADVIQVGELPAPEPQAGQVRVRLHTHGVNPTDWKRREGQRGAMPFPRVIPGYDGAGVIEAVGVGVDAGRIGQRVWVWEGAHQQWHGTAAETTCVADSRAVALPEHASFEDGACMGVPTMTACHAVMLAEAQAGDWLLVTGAAGVVCNYAVQLARGMGLRVIAVVRGNDPQKAADAQRAGAEVVINSDQDDIESAVLAHTEGQGVRGMVDVDLGAHLGFAARIVAVNGCIASFGTASNPKPVLDWTPFMNRNIRVCGVGIFSVPEARKRAIVHHVQSALQAQQLWHRVDRRFALDDFAEAHRHQAHGRPRGKVIVTL